MGAGMTSRASGARCLQAPEAKGSQGTDTNIDRSGDGAVAD